LKAHQMFMEATASIFAGEPRAACTLLERVHETVQAECPGEPWLLTNIRMNLGTVWAQIGEHRLLHAGMSTWIAAARESSDRFAWAALSGLGQGAFRHLMDDDCDAARQEIGMAMTPWPREPFALAHLGEVFAVLGAETYRGGPSARLWFEEHRAALDRAFLFKASRLLRLTLGWQHSAACLSAMEGASAREQASLRAELSASAKQLRREPGLYALGVAAHLDAQLAVLDREVDAAVAAVTSFRRWCQDQSALVWDNAAAYLEGTLLGGDTGSAQREQALLFLRNQGWKDPWRAMGMWLPVIRLLESPPASRVPHAPTVGPPHLGTMSGGGSGTP